MLALSKSGPAHVIFLIIAILSAAQVTGTAQLSFRRIFKEKQCQNVSKLPSISLRHQYRPNLT